MSESKKHILVTGASKGIGKEIARYLVQKNHTVTAIARTKAKLESLSTEFQAKINTHKVDISQPSEITSFASIVAGKIDAVVFNAGYLVNKPFLKLDDADWQRSWEVNLLSGVRLVKALHKHLNPGAHLVFISSMGGLQGSSKFPGLSAYSVSKGALSILAESLAIELAEDKISANALCLGAVQTEMLSEAFPGYKAPVTPEQMGEFIANFALTGHQFINGKVLPVALSNPSN